MLPAIPGVRLATAETNIRYKNRDDLLLAELAPGTVGAGVFTKSTTAAAPVDACRERIANGGASRALIVNAGNANAFTGAHGIAAVNDVCCAGASALGCSASDIFMCSTGVIGEILPAQKITAALPALAAALHANGWEKAARAIMTTDTFPKLATRTASIGGTRVTLNGFAKGSGMIAPDMATMLAFVFTDANISQKQLQQALAQANDASFNCITVDGDTSTNDTALLFATGLAGNANADLTDFTRALTELMIELAQLIVKDGEGAQKFISLTVTGAENARAARTIALTVANSPLVKTAIAGEDANWGRIVGAVGRSGEKAVRDRITVTIGGICVAREGAVDPAYREADIMPHMRGRAIDIAVDVGAGTGAATVWTCDLTHGYIDINGSYRS